MLPVIFRFPLWDGLIMGPYYRGTSQGVGSFFALIYEHPLVMVILAVAALVAGLYWWRRKNAGDSIQNE
jgi:hypothetical protein